MFLSKRNILFPLKKVWLHKTCTISGTHSKRMNSASSCLLKMLRKINQIRPSGKSLEAHLMISFSTKLLSRFCFNILIVLSAKCVKKWWRDLMRWHKMFQTSKLSSLAILTYSKTTTLKSNPQLSLTFWFSLKAEITSQSTCRLLDLEICSTKC